MKREIPLTVGDRLGSAAVGMFAGMIIGPLAWLLWLKAHESAPSLARFFFGGAGGGALLGFLSIDLSFGIAGAALAALVGFLGAGAVDQGARLDRIAPSFQDADTPGWRRALKWLCLGVGVVIFVVVAWR